MKKCPKCGKDVERVYTDHYCTNWNYMLGKYCFECKLFIPAEGVTIIYKEGDDHD